MEQMNCEWASCRRRESVRMSTTVAKAARRTGIAQTLKLPNPSLNQLKRPGMHTGVWDLHSAVAQALLLHRDAR